VRIHYVDSEQVERQGTGALAGMHAILVPGGFGERGIEGRSSRAVRARERHPYLGICLGMQVAVIEFCRHVAASTAPTARSSTGHPHPSSP